MPLHAEVASLLQLMEQAEVPPIEVQGAVAARAARAAAPRPQSWRTATRSSTSTPAAFPLGSTAPAPTLPAPGAAHLVPRWRLGDRRPRQPRQHLSLADQPHRRTRVLSVGYRLAPEDPFPGRTRRLRRGDHVGASRTPRRSASIPIGRRRRRFCRRRIWPRCVCHLAPAPIRFQLLVYPVTDARLGHASYTENGDGLRPVHRLGMQWFVDQYISGGHGMRSDDPQVSPLLASDETLAAARRRS